MGVPLKMPKLHGKILPLDDPEWLAYWFRASPLLAWIVGVVTAILLMACSKKERVPKGSKEYSGDPFFVGWGRGWGRYRMRTRSLLTFTVLGLFTPLLFLDTAVYDISRFMKEGTGTGDVGSIFQQKICALEAGSVEIPLSTGASNMSDVTYWSCECEVRNSVLTGSTLPHP